MLRDLGLGLIDLVYPAACILCKSSLTPVEKILKLCFACRRTFKLNRPPFCLKCSRPTENLLHKICFVCQNTAYAFEKARAAFLFNAKMQKAVHLFKYGNKSSLRHFFGHSLVTFLQEQGFESRQYNLIVPVPLHPARRRERGYNQSELLAQLLAEEFSIPFSTQILLRTRHTPNQARLSQKERWTNIQGAFKIKNSKCLAGKDILLVDDLYTTGATAHEAARVLKAAGAQTVSVVVLAVAVSKRQTN